MAKTTAPHDNEHTPDESPAARQPTSTEAAPISATAAASAGATGLDDTTRPSVFRRHPLATAIAAGALAVVLVSGLTAWGVGTAVTASLTSSLSSSSAGMPMGNATTAPGRTGGSGATATGRSAFRATIQSMDGDSWTILTRNGATVNVTMTSATQFGTKRAASTAGSFAVGDSVIIVATRGANGNPTATRVVDAGAPKRGDRHRRRMS